MSSTVFPKDDKPVSNAELVQLVKDLQARIDAQDKLIANLIHAADSKDSVTPEAKPNDLNVLWDNGLRLNANDGNTKLRLGGRMMYDVGWTSSDKDLDDAIENSKDGAELRYGRLYFGGTLNKNVSFKAQYEFAGSTTKLKDAFIALNTLSPLGTITTGQFKEPFGLEQLTSTKYTTFMERNTANVFAPGRNAGVMVSNYSDRSTFAIGVFRPTDSNGQILSERGYHGTGRITYLPFFENNKKLIHLGAAFSHQTTRDDNMIKYRTHAGNHLAPKYVNTGDFSADKYNLIGLEIATVNGPFSFQSEYISSSSSASGADDVDLSGYYSQVSYFLTGESRKYGQVRGNFGRVKPKNSFTSTGGTGAWELVCRYESLDLSDGIVTGGAVEDITLGINWYVNPNVRFMWNYVHANVDLDVPDGNSDSIMMRSQIDF
jgi:phosphate-selective porin OprO/OprP